MLRELIIDHQFARRNLTKSETVRSLAKVEQEYKREAKENLTKGGRPKTGEKGLVNLPKVSEPLHVSEKMAEKIGVSEKTYRNMRTIVNEGTPEQNERIPSGSPALHGITSRPFLTGLPPYLMPNIIISFYLATAKHLGIPPSRSWRILRNNFVYPGGNTGDPWH